MRPRMIALYVVGTLLLLIVLVLGIGASLPVEHVASRSARFDAAPDAVWQAITDYSAFPGWRSAVDTVRPLDDADPAAGWIEQGRFGPIPLAVQEMQPPTRLVLRIASEDLGFGGTWTYVVEPDGDGTRLTITENGTISNLLFRVMTRFIFGYTATMESYLVDLGAKFGEVTVPRAPGS